MPTPGAQSYHPGAPATPAGGPGAPMAPYHAQPGVGPPPVPGVQVPGQPNPMFGHHPYGTAPGPPAGHVGPSAPYGIAHPPGPTSNLPPPPPAPGVPVTVPPHGHMPPHHYGPPGPVPTAPLRGPAPYSHHAGMPPPNVNTGGPANNTGYPPVYQPQYNPNAPQYNMNNRNTPATNQVVPSTNLNPPPPVPQQQQQPSGPAIPLATLVAPPTTGALSMPGQTPHGGASLSSSTKGQHPNSCRALDSMSGRGSHHGPSSSVNNMSTNNQRAETNNMMTSTLGRDRSESMNSVGTGVNSNLLPTPKGDSFGPALDRKNEKYLKEEHTSWYWYLSLISTVFPRTYGCLI